MSNGLQDFCVLETLTFCNHIKCVLYASVWTKEEQLIVNEFGDKVGVLIVEATLLQGHSVVNL